jgi:hypothetical protein
VSDEFGTDWDLFETEGPKEAQDSGEPERKLVYASAVDFFADILAHSYMREVNQGAELLWCPEWYKHAEALARVECLWRAWEHLRWEPALGLSTWWLHHADPHMASLMAPNGPFKKCAYDGHNQGSDRLKPLPHAKPAPGTFM